MIDSDILIEVLRTLGMFVPSIILLWAASFFKRTARIKGATAIFMGMLIWLINGLLSVIRSMLFLLLDVESLVQYLDISTYVSMALYVLGSIFVALGLVAAAKEIKRGYYSDFSRE